MSVAAETKEPRRGDTGARSASPQPGGRRERRRLPRELSFSNASGLYLLAAMVVVFGLWIPDTFLTTATLKSLIVEQSIPAIVAIGLLIPLASGSFDLSIGQVIGVGTIVSAALMGTHDMAPLAAVAIVLGVGLAIGILNGLLVVYVGIDSFIATLAMGSVLGALVLAISDGQVIPGIPGGYSAIADGELLGLPLPFYYLMAAAVAVWFWLEHTPSGRRLYATGGNREAARLAGVRTDRIRFGAFIAVALFGSVGGLLLTAQLGSGSPTSGPSLLLAIYAAAFLGATQLKPGRMNVWGTVLAVFVLAVGVKGLQLVGGELWIADLFNGLALILAIGIPLLRQRLGG